mmetsp:Transcript_145628/g.254114  ORF Transcript_145628/g.254114 Transcript_145628/m.254114 type:complete len:157 (+) Transcript_145628:92-562(+)
MHKLAFLLACLAWTSFGQQEQASIEPASSDPDGESDSLKALAALLVALDDPSAAFSPTSAGQVGPGQLPVSATGPSTPEVPVSVPDTVDVPVRVPDCEMKGCGHQVTYRGTRIKRIKVSGFRSRRSNRFGRRVLKARRRKGRHSLAPQMFKKTNHG